MDGGLWGMAMLQCDKATGLYVILEIRAECTNAVQAVLTGKKGCGRLKARRSCFQRRIVLPDIRWITHDCIKPAAF